MSSANLAQYTADVGSADYMIIAATGLDDYAQGIQAAPRAFRNAWTDLQQGGKTT